MINKVELGSVNSKNIAPINRKQNLQQPSFTGANWALKAIQRCEESPMLNVAVLDLATAIIPRTFFETFIGSKQKDENGNDTGERKLNLLGGFEALRREGSGLLINCIIPSFVVLGFAELLEKPVMGIFRNSKLAGSWANSDTIDKIEKYYRASAGDNKEERMFNTLKSMFDDLEGVDGDITKGGLKKFSEIFADDKLYTQSIREMARNIVSETPTKGYATEMYQYLVQKGGIAKNIRFAGDKGFFSSSLSHLCESAGDLLHGVSKESANIATSTDLAQYFGKAKKLVNVKSIAGLGFIIPLAIAAQPINRWITHKMAGKKGAPIYNDDREHVTTPEEKKKLTAQKFIAVPAMWAVAGLSMLMDRPSLKMFQFKNIFPTMDQARIISAATFSSRLAAAEDSNELKENTIRDIATFSSFYFLGDYVAKGVATAIENKNSDGIKLINRLKSPKEGANVFERFWTWAKHTKMKSTDELGAIADTAMRTKAKNLRAVCQLSNLAFSLLSLGVIIPLYTRSQTNKKQRLEAAKLAAANSEPKTTQTGSTTFTQNLIKGSSGTFQSFFS